MESGELGLKNGDIELLNRTYVVPRKNLAMHGESAQYSMLLNTVTLSDMHDCDCCCD